MKFRLIISLTLFLSFTSLWGQVVEIIEKEEKPYVLTTEEQGLQLRGASTSSQKSPDRYTIRYVHVSPGPNGRITNISSDSVLDRSLMNEFNFPSLSIMISVAAKVITDYQLISTGKMTSDLKAFTELRQMCLNIKLEGLDTEKNVIAQLEKPFSPDFTDPDFFVHEFGKEPLLTLGISPSQSSYTTEMPQTAQILETLRASGNLTRFLESSNFLKLGQVATFINPIGAFVSGVTAIFDIFTPSKNLPTQLSYLDSNNEFGWIWREQERQGIEGIHQCMALLRTHKSIKYILVHVDLITDWKRFGAWNKKVDFIVPVVGSN